MARGLSIRMKYEPIRELASGSIVAGFTAIGTAVQHPIRLIALTNLTDATLYFSFDGINSHIVLPANGFIVHDITANKTQDTGLYLAKGDKCYVKQLGAPSSGSVYFSAMYGE